MYHWSRKESQILFLDTPSAGTFKLGDGTSWTGDIAYDASAATIQTALEVLYGAGGVTVEEGEDFLITFALSVGASGLTSDFASLVDGDGASLTVNKSYTTQELKIIWGSYRPPHSATLISEINVIPSPTLPSPITILQQGGNERLSTSMQAYVSTLFEYNSLVIDHHAASVKTFYGPEGEEFESIIRTISPPEYVQPGHVRFSLVFMEVSS